MSLPHILPAKRRSKVVQTFRSDQKSLVISYHRLSLREYNICRPETDSESDDEVVAGPLGQLRGVEDSSDSDSDLLPQLR